MTDEREVPDYQTVKAWFRQLWELEADIESVQVEIRRLKDSATQCTANLSGMPSGSGDGDKVGSCIANDLSLPNENRVSLYVREGCKYLATVWDTFSL